MGKSRFSDEQIIAMIRGHDSGVKTADICRKCGLSEARNIIEAWRIAYNVSGV